MPLRNFGNPNKETRFVCPMSDRAAACLQDTITSPALDQGREPDLARLIHYSVVDAEYGSELLVELSPYGYKALEWLADQLDEWHWLEAPSYSVAKHGDFRGTCERIRGEIRYVLSDGHLDTLGEPEGVAS